MRFLSYLFVLLLLARCLMGVPGQSAGPIQKDYAAKEIKAWQGRLADGTPLTRKQLEELLAAHKAWLQIAQEKLEEERKKANQPPLSTIKEEDEKAWLE